jgi:hypothetical protein
MRRNSDPAETAVTRAVAGDATAPEAVGAADQTPAVGSRLSGRMRSRKRRVGMRSAGTRTTDDLVALLSAELDGPTITVKDGERCTVTKRELIAARLVDRSANADLHATKLLVELLDKIQQAPHAADPGELDAADEKVIATVLARLGMAE